MAIIPNQFTNNSKVKKKKCHFILRTALIGETVIEEELKQCESANTNLFTSMAIMSAEKKKGLKCARIFKYA